VRRVDDRSLSRHLVALVLCAAAALAITSAAPAASLLDRGTSDRPDEQLGPQIHVIYAVPAAGPDRSLDTNGTLAGWIGIFNNWLASQSGGVRVRIDTFQGQPDITYVPLPNDTDVPIQLWYLGYNDPNKKYLVYVEGSAIACGLGGGQYASVYLQTQAPPGYGNCQNIDWAMTGLHEVFHALGAVHPARRITAETAM